MSISLLKLALNALGSPTSVAILGSVGAHALLGISLPALSVFSPGQPGPSEVPIVELTAEELARLPDLEPAPAIPFVPPAATQLLPLPDNFELPSVAQNPSPKASIPALPPKPSVNSSGKASSLSVPQKIVTHRTRGRTPGISSTRVAVGQRNATSLENFMRNRRAAVDPGNSSTFQVDPNKSPGDVLRESLEPKQTPVNPHVNNDEIAQLEFEEPTKTPAENTADGTESELDPATPGGQPARPTPEGQTEESSGMRDRDSSETENEPTSTPADRQPEASSEGSPRAEEENEPAPPEERDRPQPPARQTPPPRPRSETQPDNPARIESPQTQGNSRENPASESQTQVSPRANPEPEPQRQQRQETQPSPQTSEERETREEEDAQNSEELQKDTSKAAESDRSASDVRE